MVDDLGIKSHIDLTVSLRVLFLSFETDSSDIYLLIK